MFYHLAQQKTTGRVAWSSSCSRNAHDRNVLVRRTQSRIDQATLENKVGDWDHARWRAPSAVPADIWQTCGLQTPPSTTSGNLTPQETTNQDTPDRGLDRADLSCPGSNAIAVHEDQTETGDCV